MPDATWMQVEFVQTTVYELAMKVTYPPASFSSKLFVKMQ